MYVMKNSLLTVYAVQNIICLLSFIFLRRLFLILKMITFSLLCLHGEIINCMIFYVSWLKLFCEIRNSIKNSCRILFHTVQASWDMHPLMKFENYYLFHFFLAGNSLQSLSWLQNFYCWILQKRVILVLSNVLHSQLLSSSHWLLLTFLGNI